MTADEERNARVDMFIAIATLMARLSVLADTAIVELNKEIERNERNNKKVGR